MDIEKKQSDSELIELSKKSPESFGLLMHRYKEPLFHYIRRITQYQKEDIEDILQEVFIKIFLKLNEYNEELKFSSWAYRIAHNHVIDHFRKMNSRPRSYFFDEGEIEKLVGSGINLEKKLEAKDCAEKVKKILFDLPLKYREVLVLRFVEEKEYGEIMDILKKPKGSVATLIARGKKALAAGLRKDGIDCL
jgi:RNA polymerase sigma-70 factor (ECF subfamily)